MSNRYTVETSQAFINQRIIAPYQSGPLDGLTFAIKDLIDTAGDITRCGNPDWEKTHRPAVANAICVDQLLGAGAKAIGKTITNELAFGLTGENHFDGTPINPAAPDRVPGGSSSGSASAVAAGLCDFALGTDTGGSVRVPAANCGIYGIRTSYGRISPAGVNPLAPSFDSVGVFAKDIETLKKSTRVLLGSGNEQASQALKCILIPEDILAQCDPATVDATNSFISQLEPHYSVKRTQLREIVATSVDLATLFQHFCRIHWSEIWTSLGGWVDAHKPRLGPATTINFELAKNADRAALYEAFNFRQHFSQALNQYLGNSQLLLLPTTPAVPPVLGTVSKDRTKGDYLPRLSGLSSLAVFAGSPQVTLPLASVEGIPQGLSLMASHFQDEWLLDQCQAIIARLAMSS
jgi:amidase